MPQKSKAYSALEAAKRIGVSYDTVLRYIRDGDMEAAKVQVKGKKKEWRINEKEIKKFI